MGGSVFQAIGLIASAGVLGAGLTGAGLTGAGLTGAGLTGAATPGPAGAAGAARPAMAYVVNTGANTVVPLNLATNTAGRAIKVGLGPDAIVFSPDGKTAYVADGAYGDRRPADTVAVIDTKTSAVGRFIKVPPRPTGLVITPDGKTLYVLSQSGVTPISTSTKKAGPLIKVGSDSAAIAIMPDGKNVYVANYVANTVIPISTATNKAGKPIPVGDGPDHLAITPDSRAVYVLSGRFGRPDRNPGTVTVINTATNTAARPVKLGGFPSDVTFAPDGKHAYIVTDVPVVRETPMTVATGKLGRPVLIAKPARGSGPGYEVITPNGKTLYVDSWATGTLTPVRTSTGLARKPIKLAGGPLQLTISPDGARVYVSCGGIAVISTATGKVIKTIAGVGGIIAIQP
jgi:YVTN family beta-propeller protein